MTNTFDVVAVHAIGSNGLQNLCRVAHQNGDEYRGSEDAILMTIRWYDRRAVPYLSFKAVIQSSEHFHSQEGPWQVTGVVYADMIGKKGLHVRDVDVCRMSDTLYDYLEVAGVNMRQLFIAEMKLRKPIKIAIKDPEMKKGITFESKAALKELETIVSSPQIVSFYCRKPAAARFNSREAREFESRAGFFRESIEKEQKLARPRPKVPYIQRSYRNYISNSDETDWSSFKVIKSRTHRGSVIEVDSLRQPKRRRTDVVLDGVTADIAKMDVNNGTEEVLNRKSADVPVESGTPDYGSAGSSGLQGQQRKLSWECVDVVEDD